MNGATAFNIYIKENSITLNDEEALVSAETKALNVLQRK